MLTLVKLPVLAAQFDAQKQTFERHFSGHLKFFLVVNTICLTEQSFSGGFGSATVAVQRRLRFSEFELAW